MKALAVLYLLAGMSGIFDCGAALAALGEEFRPPRVTRQSLPALCDQFDAPAATRSRIMSSSAQLDPEYVIVVSGTEYSVGVRETDARIVYISTSAASFRTLDGLGIGSHLAEARRHATDPLSMEPGWGYFLHLRSGWCAGFFVGSTGTDSEPTDDAPVSWFFQRKRSCDGGAS